MGFLLDGKVCGGLYLGIVVRVLVYLREIFYFNEIFRIL